MNYFHLESQSATISLPVEQAVAVCVKGYRGKSGLHRASCLLTGGRGDAMASAAENRPPGNR